MASLDRAAYDVWKLHYATVERRLASIERTERAILRKIKCPTDTVALYAILNGEQPPPWPAKTDARARQRARHAMHVLTMIDNVRRHIAFGSENACRAADWALLVGLYANDAAVNAVMADRRNVRGGHTRARQQGRDVAGLEAAARRLIARWRVSELLQQQYRTPAVYLSSRLDMTARTAQRYARRLTQSA